MGALKDEIDGELVDELANVLTGAWGAFPAERFRLVAGDGLDALELKARLAHVADALADALPDDPAEVVAVVDGALGDPRFDGWMVWPVSELLGRLGPADPELVVPLLARITHRSTSEFAIRPCIDERPELTWPFLESWVDDPDEHVRRLVSEGTRPRLPWGRRLRALQADPTRSIVLLDRLRDDASPYVRRSVANHLGDIVKDHPQLALDTAERWIDAGGDHVAEVVRHGLRTLVKAGDPDALRLIGYDVDAPMRLVDLTLDPAELPIGGQATIALELVTDGAAPVPVVVEYLIHYLGPRGPRKPKAYRLAERVLEPGVPLSLRRRQTFRHASIRTLTPGDHLVEVQVNGRVLGAGHIELTDEPG